MVNIAAMAAMQRGNLRKIDRSASTPTPGHVNPDTAKELEVKLESRPDEDSLISRNILLRKTTTASDSPAYRKTLAESGPAASPAWVLKPSSSQTRAPATPASPALVPPVGQASLRKTTGPSSSTAPGTPLSSGGRSTDGTTKKP
eukprot:TRINITY_DN18603_c0_g1_i1.p1 TRINITY_DN18603_c0_g1~~TRINITY_DN18603_c0_g1_i1.p1  ORF type:complete len:145 (-),score=34.33 TRINITY_DN18603_c0_g1_i1:64-498(-)